MTMALNYNLDQVDVSMAMYLKVIHPVHLGKNTDTMKTNLPPRTGGNNASILAVCLARKLLHFNKLHSQAIREHLLPVSLSIDSMHTISC